MSGDYQMTEQYQIDKSEIATLKENIRIMREQNITLSEAYLKVLMKSDRYRTALEGICERTGGIIKRLASNALGKL